MKRNKSDTINTLSNDIDERHSIYLSHLITNRTIQAIGDCHVFILLNRIKGLPH